MDAIAVLDTNGDLHCSPFFLRFESSVSDSVTSMFLGLPGPTAAALASGGKLSQSSEGQGVWPWPLGGPALKWPLKEDIISPCPPPVEYCLSMEINGHPINTSDSSIPVLLPHGRIGFFCPHKKILSNSPSTEGLKKFPLKMMKNSCRIFLPASSTSPSASPSTPPTFSLSFMIYVVTVFDSFVIMDIDGTVTKSDVTGMISNVFRKFDYVHDGLARLLTFMTQWHEEFFTQNFLSKDAKNQKSKELNEYRQAFQFVENFLGRNQERSKVNHFSPVSPTLSSFSSSSSQDDSNDPSNFVYIPKVHILYLTARAYAQRGMTRSFLSNVKQRGPPLNFSHLLLSQDKRPGPEKAPKRSQTSSQDRASWEHFSLPDGPLFLNDADLLSAFWKEVVKKESMRFKMGMLERLNGVMKSARYASVPSFRTDIDPKFLHTFDDMSISGGDGVASLSTTTSSSSTPGGNSNSTGLLPTSGPIPTLLVKNPQNIGDISTSSASSLYLTETALSSPPFPAYCLHPFDMECGFLMGFGNREHDAIAYHSVGVSRENIFVIDTSSRLAVWSFGQRVVLNYLKNRQGFYLSDRADKAEKKFINSLSSLEDDLSEEPLRDFQDALQDHRKRMVFDAYDDPLAYDYVDSLLFSSVF